MYRLRRPIARSVSKKRVLQIVILIVTLLIGILALSYQAHQNHQKNAQALKAESEASYQSFPCGYQQKCSGSSLKTTNNETTEIDCSNYSAPGTPYSITPFGSYSPYSAQCGLKCDLENLGLLAYQSKGVMITQQIYEEIYVKQIQKDKCGTPLPYCDFNPSVKCPASSATLPTESGYAAGYSYGEQYQICDSNYDNGKSQAFNDGVNAWTADNCTDGQLN